MEPKGRIWEDCKKHLPNMLSIKIFLDRYAEKDVRTEKETPEVGSLVLFRPDTYRKELGIVLDNSGYLLKVKTLDEHDETQEYYLPLSQLDIPLEGPTDMWKRVAQAVASVEKTEEKQKFWEGEFYSILEGWKFIPGGRILAGAGLPGVTLANCFVIPSPKDTRQGILDTLSQMVELMSRGGGVGINVSTLRPRAAYCAGVNGRSSGSTSWASLYSFVTGLVEQGGSRRGALMLITEEWHPDIEEFINCKREAGKVTNANISVALSDRFMQAVEKDGEWKLEFPDTSTEDYDNLWDGDLVKWKIKGYKTIVYKTLKARDLWNQIINSAWASAEPGVWFKGRVDHFSNSQYYDRGRIIATNPCGEQSLPANSVCNLGHLNLAKIWEYSKEYPKTLEEITRTAVRFLDNVVSLSNHFLPEIDEQQQRERRVGLGTLGLAEWMIKEKLRYGSSYALQMIEDLYERIALYAYDASVDLAKEKGAFPEWKEEFWSNGFANELFVAGHNPPIRNVTLLTQAPTGTVGTMVGTSTGIEPFFNFEWKRNSRLGSFTETMKVWQDWKEKNPGKEKPDYFVTAMDLTPEEHIKTQAVIQKWTDSSISKTCNVPNHYTVEQVGELYKLMYNSGCKGGTIYRDGSRSEQVLENVSGEKPKKKNKKMPGVREGKTNSVKTPLGKAHVTLNKDPNEVFITVGKAGSDAAGFAEALGRLISLALKNEVEMGDIISQLKGIGGTNQVGLGPSKVSSLADGVAKALEGLSGLEVETVSTDLCPSCGNSSMVSEDGCFNCKSCGYSKCG